MKLVVMYESTDGYTYSCINTIPMEYESAEALLVDLEQKANEYIADMKAYSLIGAKCKTIQEKVEAYTNTPYPIGNKYMVGGLMATPFVYEDKFVAPQIYTVDEWFSAWSNGEVP